MQCTEVKERLSEYIDGVLDPETRGLMEEHLAACEGCAGELTSLRTLIQELGSLDPVEPPRDFFEQLHESLETPSRLSRLLRSLFVPFRIKVPLEFAGAAVVGLLIFFVLQVQQPLREISPMTQALKQEGAAPKVLPRPQAPPPGGEEKTMPLLKEQEMENKIGYVNHPIELILVLKGRPGTRTTVSETFTQSAPMEGREEMDRSAAGQSSSDSLSSSHDGYSLEKKGAPSPAIPASRMKGRALFMENDLKTNLRKATEIIRLAGGEIRMMPDEKDSSGPPSIILNIPSDHLPGLLKSLETLGTLENPPETLPLDSRANVQVRLRFLSSER